MVIVLKHTLVLLILMDKVMSSERFGGQKRDTDKITTQIVD